MFWQVICTCEGWYYKINCKYERCKLTKTKACCKYVSCSFIYSFILLEVFHQTNLMNWDTSNFFKIWSSKNVWNFDVYLIKFMGWNKFGEIILTMYEWQSLNSWLVTVLLSFSEGLIFDFVSCKIFC